ncbi:alcohol dehydrogenase catalytic domain-containing protein [Streptomyces sp. WI04-05B]|uniref:alcohol dehydrogenase catalytic domain-containing protein n=1 Tax=Streptomyces TaxID=1883 RepID=UPI0029A370F8|nr:MULTISPECIES: alcohol dehydrogenase catalytic domain-containing protein [unclassified Streptomyces]MDX2546459.1 alcohol dehydrogenase catalytic domain-containing protein [Streptomyces sp. WI04-05B]MDX2586180.1 alcohol dehydrogenase catalytic domain-containing protein [Streptomyces sp. WI04-05A]MDX3748831.1 alcohol dehydrogenase catalytic domain-containing protein [Streptomyces sp. AK08-02]
MKAAVWYGAGDVRIAEVDVPVVRIGEVLIEVAYCAICGSDLHEYADGPHAIPVAEPHPASGATAPLVLGHEFCGTVADLAAGAGRRHRKPCRAATRQPVEKAGVLALRGKERVRPLGAGRASRGWGRP